METEATAIGDLQASMECAGSAKAAWVPPVLGVMSVLDTYADTVPGNDGVLIGS